MSEDSKKIRRTNIGGQAVIEGVMMRGQKVYAMAVRTPENGITLEKSDVKGGSATKNIFKYPIFRGIAAFLDSLIMGTKLIMRSAELAGESIEEDSQPSKFDAFLEKKFGDNLNDYLIYFSVFVSVLLAVGLFFLLPIWIGSLLKNIIKSPGMMSFMEGIIRICIFLIYILLISKMKDIQRVFQYHGAEHKTINCFESGEDLTVENVRTHTRMHKRCGTSFLLIVMVVSMVVFFFVRTDSIFLRLLSRIILVPFVAGISYEIIRWAGRSESKLVGIISYPGLCLQKLTTREPDDEQIAVAIAAMKGVLEDEPEE